MDKKLSSVSGLVTLIVMFGCIHSQVLGPSEIGCLFISHLQNLSVSSLIQKFHVFRLYVFKKAIQYM